MSDNETQWWKKYVPEQEKNIPQKSFKNLLEVCIDSLNSRRYSRSGRLMRNSDYNENALYDVLAHKDCTEKDLVDLAKNARVDFEPQYDEVEGKVKPSRKKYNVDELNIWGKIFMDPHASEELREVIVDRGDISQDVIDHYLQREDCPQELLPLAVQDTMSSYFHRYYRNTDYEVDAEKLNEIVAHPNMTERAFDEALYIVREDMVEYAEDPEVAKDRAFGHYQGEDDTCDLTQADKEKIMQTMLKNKACTPEIALEIFEAAEKAGLSKDISEFNKKENLFPGIERKLQLKQVRDKVHNTPDHLTVKQAGDTELNKTVMAEKFLDGDPLAKKKSGNTRFNKTVMKLRQKMQSDR